VDHKVLSKLRVLEYWCNFLIKKKKLSLDTLFNMFILRKYRCLRNVFVMLFQYDINIKYRDKMYEEMIKSSYVISLYIISVGK